MRTFNLHIKLEAASEAEAAAAMKALLQLYQHLSLEDLQLFAHTAQHKPGLIQKAKRFL
jgi:hypothetical protein